MIYTKTITTPINTSKNSPLDNDLPVTNGLIYKVEFYFPPGSSGLMGVMVLDGSYQAWPSEPGEWFFGDNTTISFDDKYWIAAPDHKLKVRTYNLDDTYPHVLQIRVGQVLQEAFVASLLPTMGIQAIQDMIKELVEAQGIEREDRRQAVIDYFTAGKEK